MPKKYFHASVFTLLFFFLFNMNPTSAAPDHPRLMADAADIAQAKIWLRNYPWYRQIFDERQAEIDRFIQHRPIFVSPVKQIYQYKMYTCPKHDVELLYEEFRPHEHRCPKDTSEAYSGGKYDSAWAGWYNRLLASHLVRWSTKDKIFFECQVLGHSPLSKQLTVPRNFQKQSSLSQERQGLPATNLVKMFWAISLLFL